MARTSAKIELGLALMVAFACSEEAGPSGPTLVRKITSEVELIDGVGATGRVGDYLLENGRARFLIEDAASSTGWGIYGGGLIDLAGPAAAPADDRLQQLFVHCDLRAFRPSSVEVVSDGRSGGPGILRFVGDDAGIPVLDAIIARDPLQVQLTVDYVLEPDRDSLEIIIRAKDLMKTVSREIACGLVMIRGDQSEIFVEGFGSDEDQAGGAQPFLASAAHDSPTSWVLYRQGPPVQVILAQAEVVPIGPRGVPFLANATIEERYRVGVGARGDVESALEIVRRDQEQPLPGRPVTLNLTKAAELDVPLLQVVMTVSSSAAPRRVWTAVKPDVSGQALFQLPNGIYSVELSLQGRSVERFGLEVPPGEGPLVVDHRLSGLGVVEVRSLEIDRLGVELGPTPVRVFVAPGHDRPFPSGFQFQTYLEPTERFFMPAGDYTLWASRGPAHQLYAQNLTVTADRTTQVEARLVKVVELGPWISADFHLHSTRSVDSAASKRLRALGGIAEGLEVMVATDHDALTDYGPTLRALGLQDKLQSVVGTEMSMLYGHMNGWPLRLTQERESYWSPSWAVYQADRFIRMLDPHEVAEALRGAGAQIVQINHPRDGQGVFGYLGLDPLTAATDKPWPDVQTVELLNGKRVGDYPRVQEDFFNLTAHGKKITAVGVSDSHSPLSGPGYARTLIKGPGGPVGTLDLSAVWQSVREGRVTAMLGPFAWLTAQKGGVRAEQGETLAASGPLQLEVKIAAASHISVEAFTVFENGRPLVTRTVTPADADPGDPAIRFLGTVTATPTADAHYELEVRGGNNAPFADSSLSFTNPVYVDTDGNGFVPGG